jgi:3' terminal RNA ribose 2'-O-methyltransferase Hen1
MFLSLTTTHRPATDLGYLLHKRPGQAQSFPLSFGKAHVVYSEATPDRCTAMLLLDLDPVGLARDRQGASAVLEQYVNDRPYVASSFLSVAIAQVFGSALSGTSRERPALADTPIPLEARLAVVPCRGGEVFLRRLFEPLGYAVTVVRHTLDDTFPDWGHSSYHTVAVSRVCRLHELLSHLYVLVPVLDDDKHYWVGEAEVDKLLRHGEGWLATHPEREIIARRYLKHQSRLMRSALASLMEETGETENPDEAEEVIEERISLNEQRLNAVATVLRERGAKRILDLGCGEGKLLRLLLKEPSFSEVVGVDVSARVLEIARERLDRMPERVRDRATLLQGSLTYRDCRLEGFDAAAVVEVIEHLDPPRLTAFERVLFGCARPRLVVMTTPNAEYNIKFEGLPAGKMRHADHRFEWTRAQFRTWAENAARRFGHAVRFMSIGPEDEVVGSPTQMAVFEQQS